MERVDPRLEWPGAARAERTPRGVTEVSGFGGALPAPGPEVLPRRLRIAALIAAVVLAELALGVMVVDPRFRPLLAMGAALAALALVFRFPFAAIVLVLVLVASVLPADVASVPAGPVELTLAELTLGAVVLVALVRPRRAWWGGAAGGALAVFFGVVLLATVIAMQAGRTGLSDAFATVRPLGLLALFYVVVRLLPERQQVDRLLTAATVVAAVTAAVSLLLAAPGAPLADFVADRVQGAITTDEGLGVVNRVRLPGVMLGFALFWYAAVRWATSRGRERVTWLGLGLLIGAGIAVSFNRNMWAGLVFGLLVMLALAAPVRRQFLAVLVVVIAVGLGIGLSSARVSSGSPLYPIVERGATLLDPSATSREDSLDDRQEENDAAVPAIREHPVLGVGPGAPFGRRATIIEANGARTERVDQLWVHNQYLHLALLGGLPALLAFLAFVGFVLRDGVRRASQDVPALAMTVALFTVLLSAIVMIYVVNPTGAAVIGLVGGAITVFAAERVRARPVL